MSRSSALDHDVNPWTFGFLMDLPFMAFFSYFDKKKGVKMKKKNWIIKFHGAPNTISDFKKYFTVITRD